MKKSYHSKYCFLINANISRTIISLLRNRLNLDIIHISTFSESMLSDTDVVEIAKKEKRIIITHDLDYGEIYYLHEQGKIGVIMLRLTNQTSTNVISKLYDFFTSPQYKKINLANSLVIISDTKVRIFSP